MSSSASVATPVIMFLGFIVFVSFLFFILRVWYDLWIVSYILKLLNLKSFSSTHVLLIILGVFFGLIVLGIIFAEIDKSKHSVNKNK